VSAAKTWEVWPGEDGKPRHILIESTPYDLLKPHLDALPLKKEAMLRPGKLDNIKTALLKLERPSPPARLSDPPHHARNGDLEIGSTVATAAVSRSETLNGKTLAPGYRMAFAQKPVDAEPGVVLDFLIVTTPLLNVDLGWGGKYGFAAVGQESWDYWNQYYYAGNEPGGSAGLYWSDWTSSSVGLVVTNGAGTGYNPFCADSMYQYFIHPSSSGNVSVAITNLPSDVYDVFVYATRASDAGAPQIELKVGGTSLWKKGTTIYGSGWLANPWEEHEQYVRFRDVAVTNQTLTLISFPDASGYASLSGLQIVASSAVPAYGPEITGLINCNFGGDPTWKAGPAAVGFSSVDYWNHWAQGGASSGGIDSLKWSNTNSTAAGLSIRNAPGSWSNLLPDMMLRSYVYSWNAGNVTITMTNLPSGNCDVYLYGHTATTNDNAIYELWSDEVAQGIKGTSLIGYGPTSNVWEVGQQYVLFKDVVVSSNKPVVIHSKHNTAGYNNVSGLQIAYKGDTDSDEDGLPDGWEIRWLGALYYSASDDTDGDGLTNLREYQLSLDPARSDSNGNGISDLMDCEFVWIEEAVPQGGYQYGTSESWNWFTSWYDGDGWGGATIYPHSGDMMHVSAKVTGSHQHYFERAVSVVRPRPGLAIGEKLYAWINLDSSYPPSEVMLQFYVVESNGSGSWEHRAYWGANSIASGVDGTMSRTNMGGLPAAGQWVRLEVPATAVGLEGKIIEGMAFTLYDGRAAWDSAGILNPDVDGNGLLDSWEMQYWSYVGINPYADDDGDGWTNLEEFLNGTNPVRPELSILITEPKRGSNLP
jgi:hypothetical protein